MDVLSAIILLILAVIGAAALLHTLRLALLSSNKGTPFVLAVPVSGHREDVEYIVRCAAARANWGIGGKTCVYIIDCGMDADTLELCRRVCNQMDCVCLMDCNEFEQQLVRDPSLD